MKILHLIGSMDPVSGGPCQVIRNSVPEMSTYGIHSEVASLDSPDCPFLGSDSFPIHALGPGKTSWHYSPKFIPWLFKNLLQFDLIIVHGLWNYHDYAIRKVLDALRHRYNPNKAGTMLPAVFVFPHGMLDPWFQLDKSRRLKAVRNWVYWNLIERNVVNKADGLLFTCEQELLLARRTFRPYSPKKELNVGLGIAEPPAFSEAGLNAFYQLHPGLRGSPYLLYLGRIHPKKGVDMLISVYQKLDREGWALPMLVVAGPEEDLKYSRRIRALAGNNPRILFSGMLVGDVKWGAIYGSQAFVLPSHQENFGIAVVEALACGRPVLITNQVNISREIEALGGGIIDQDTEDGFERILKKWVQMSDDQKQNMSINAKKAYNEKFTVKAAVRQFVSSINSA